MKRYSNTSKSILEWKNFWDNLCFECKFWGSIFIKELGILDQNANSFLYRARFPCTMGFLPGKGTQVLRSLFFRSIFKQLYTYVRIFLGTIVHHRILRDLVDFFVIGIGKDTSSFRKADFVPRAPLLWGSLTFWRFGMGILMILALSFSFGALGTSFSLAPALIPEKENVVGNGKR